MVAKNETKIKGADCMKIANLQEEKVIQIMPAPQNLYVEYENEENPEKPFRNQALCLALTDQGEIFVMDISDCGMVDKAESVSNYLGVAWDDKEKKESR
jgi:hypothetical protein